MWTCSGGKFLSFENLNLMNSEKQRFAIAEECGWRRHPDDSQVFVRPGMEPNSVRGIVGANTLRLPDYINDLNAMHQAEKVLASREDCDRFQNLLLLAKPGPADAQCAAERWTWHATAAHRAEAFLRTIGKWEDEEGGQP